MLIREAQIKAFEQTAIDNYIIELAAHCRKFSPRLCKTLQDEQLHAAIKQGIERAEGYGFDQRGPVRFYVEMMILFGGGFDSDPQYPWARQMLKQEDSGQMERAETLHEKTTAYLAEVDGTDNVHTLQALSELQALCTRGVEFHRESFEPDMLRLMREMHPRKFAETGEEALRRLIADGIELGQKRYKFQAARSLGLMVVLMFAFGHHFDSDPFHPWIARTLRQPNQPDSDITAKELEQRALIWLDAVLRNAKEDK